MTGEQMAFIIEVAQQGFAWRGSPVPAHGQVETYMPYSERRGGWSYDGSGEN